MTSERTDWTFMRAAIDAAKQSVHEHDKSRVAPLVGAVAGRDGALLAHAYRGERRPGEHAEYSLLTKLDFDLTHATLYTTLEPCSKRGPNKVPCAERLATSGVAVVFIGLYDPNPDIYRQGWRHLRDAGIVVRDFPAELRAEIAADNASFLDQFRTAAADNGLARFDFRQYAGRFVVKTNGAEFATRWTERGADSIYALDHSHHVAIARFATSFEAIDDPGALDFSSYTVPVGVGEIVVFRRDSDYLLVQILEVHAGPDRGSTKWELRIAWQWRTPRFLA